MIHTPGALAQVDGGTIMGLGYAMTEELHIDPHTGIPVTQSLYEYRPPTILDVPEIVPILVEAPVPAGPFGAKGLGENPMFNAAAAIGNAIYNATGVQDARDSVHLAACVRRTEASGKAGVTCGRSRLTNRSRSSCSRPVRWTRRSSLPRVTGRTARSWPAAATCSTS